MKSKISISNFILLFITCFILGKGFRVFADDTEFPEWSIEVKNGFKKVTILTDPPIQHELISIGGPPEILGMEQSPVPGILLLNYDSGMAGTYVIIHETRAIVFSEEGHLIGDFSRSLEKVGAKPDQQEPIQPEWHWGDQYLIVNDPNYGEQRVSLLPPE